MQNIKIGKIKVDTPGAQPHVIPEVGEIPKSDIRMERTGIHKYNTRSSTKRVNHVTTFKNAPKIFQEEAKENIRMHMGTDYFSFIYPKGKTATLESMANHSKCKTTGKIFGYRDLVNIDEPVWTNSTCNELGHLSRRWKKYAGTDTIQFIFHKDKPKYRKVTYVRAVCDIRPQKIETHRTILTSGGNLIGYPGEVSTPTSGLATMKLYFNSVISDVESRYICMDVKYFDLNNKIDRAEYIMMQISMIPQAFLENYNLRGKAHNEYISSRVTKGMYGIPQEG